MKNFISINGQKTELTEEQVQQIKASFGVGSVRLGDVTEGDTAKIGKHEMIVMDHIGAATLLLRKDSLARMRFGANNNYDGSDVDKLCNEFAEEIARIVGEENILPHEVDLTSDDGLKDYGKIERKASLRTTELQRRYVYTLDKYRLDFDEWLATAYSTPTHEDDEWVKCVSPSGHINDVNDIYDVTGVRPFCILNSNIFVSK